MTRYHIPVGESGPFVAGEAGQVLGFVSDNELEAVDAGGGALRADWCVSPSFATFAPGQTGPIRDVIFEPNTLVGIEVGDTIFLPANTCLVGAFHAGSAAPQFGGLYDVITKTSEADISVARNAQMSTAAQIATIAVVACDAGTGAGVYQVATPASAAIDTDPQVHYAVSLVPLNNGLTNTLQESGGFLQWVVPPPVPLVRIVTNVSVTASTFEDVVINVGDIDTSLYSAVIATFGSPPGLPPPADIGIQGAWISDLGEVTVRFWSGSFSGNVDTTLVFVP